MRIASRINAALLGIFACGTVASYAVLEATIHPRFDEIERARAIANHQRILEGLEASTEKLATATQDYAFWDETYSFVQGENTEEFITSNLTPEFSAVENLGVHALIFLGPQGEIRWGAAYDLETREPVEGLVNELTQFSAHFVHYVGTQNNFSKRGIFRTSKGLVLAAIAPVLKSDRSGIPLGKIISAKLLDVEAIQALTGANFSIDELASPFGPSEAPPELTLTAFDDRVETKTRLDSLTGEPLGWLTARYPRDISHMGGTAVRSALLLMVLAFLVATAVLWAYLKYAIVGRIEQLKDHIATAGGSGTIRRTAAISRKDEIGDLALSFNSMVDQVNHLRDALAESAYMAGLSEWAAGTLHNVRNGIAPATAAAWHIERLYDGGWMQNVETAIREHSDENTSPERKPKLNAFLVASVARLVEAAKTTSRMTGSINDAARSVIEMAAEFESYARRTTEMEPVDLESLIRDTAHAVKRSHAPDCELILPSAGIEIESNAIVLRQILSNVFINAMEAIKSSKRRGIIEVSISPSPDQDGFARIVISDNGDGISPEILSTAFKRGVSTRHDKKGGLGLHWCANAIKTLGGTIGLESEGKGCGARITIKLPVKQDPAHQEAA